MTRRTKHEASSDGKQYGSSDESSQQAILEEEYVQKTVSTTVLQGLSFQKVLGDGHCLFHAVGLYLGQDAAFLRRIVAAHMKENSEAFHPFRPGTEAKFRTYIQTIHDGKEEGDHIEIEIIQRLTDRPIIIIRSDVKPTIPDNLEAYKGKPIFLYYTGDGDHGHYDAFLVQNDSDAEAILGRIQRSIKKGQTVTYHPPVTAQTRTDFSIDFSQENSYQRIDSASIMPQSALYRYIAKPPELSSRLREIKKIPYIGTFLFHVIRHMVWLDELPHFTELGVLFLHAIFLLSGFYAFIAEIQIYIQLGKPKKYDTGTHYAYIEGRIEDQAIRNEAWAILILTGIAFIGGLLIYMLFRKKIADHKPYLEIFDAIEKLPLTSTLNGTKRQIMINPRNKEEYHYFMKYWEDHIQWLIRKNYWDAIAYLLRAVQKRFPPHMLPGDGRNISEIQDILSEESDNIVAQLATKDQDDDHEAMKIPLFRETLVLILADIVAQKPSTGYHPHDRVKHLTQFLRHFVIDPLPLQNEEQQSHSLQLVCILRSAKVKWDQWKYFLKPDKVNTRAFLALPKEKRNQLLCTLMLGSIGKFVALSLIHDPKILVVKTYSLRNLRQIHDVSLSCILKQYIATYHSNGILKEHIYLMTVKAKDRMLVLFENDIDAAAQILEVLDPNINTEQIDQAKVKEERYSEHARELLEAVSPASQNAILARIEKLKSGSEKRLSAFKLFKKPAKTEHQVDIESNNSEEEEQKVLLRDPEPPAEDYGTLEF